MSIITAYSKCVAEGVHGVLEFSEEVKNRGGGSFYKRHGFMDRQELMALPLSTRCEAR
jgi:hypothetical protein